MLWGLCACAAPELAPYRETRAAMGTTFSITVYASDGVQAGGALEAAFARVMELDGLLSDHDPSSELSRLSERSAGQATPVSPHLWAVLVGAAEINELSAGAFDVTVGPLSRLWRRARRRAEHPRAEHLTRARAAVGARHLLLDPVHRTVTLALDGMRLDLGAIAKGYALDQVLRVLEQHGIVHALVEGGGDLAAGEPPPQRAGWHLAVEVLSDVSAPRVQLSLARAALATSGDLYQHTLIDGVRSSHIIDPRTGLGLTRRVGATVVAESGLRADALASALCVLGPEHGLALVETLEGVEARLVTLEDGELQAHESSGFRLMMVPSPRPTQDGRGRRLSPPP
ncbi:MAG TPA: FAD:protein FMN transferase [Planctomycetota bacterium]|nr:FAD:protein FMN transferase [Planctomycetota bacterium]